MYFLQCILDLLWEAESSLDLKVVVDLKRSSVVTDVGLSFKKIAWFLISISLPASCSFSLCFQRMDREKIQQFILWLFVQRLFVKIDLSIIECRT